MIYLIHQKTEVLHAGFEGTNNFGILNAVWQTRQNVAKQ